MCVYIKAIERCKSQFDFSACCRVYIVYKRQNVTNKIKWGIEKT